MNLIKNHQPDIDKDPFELKYQLLINGRKKIGTKKLKNPKAFIDYSQTIDDVYENVEDYNSKMKRKVLIVLDADMEANKKLTLIFITELFLRGRKLNISFVSKSQSFFKIPKTIKLNMASFYHENT